MAPIACLLVAFNLLVVSRSQIALPQLPKWSTRRLAAWAETQSFESDDCDPQRQTHHDKAAIGCSLTLSKKMAYMMNLPEEWDGMSYKYTCNGDSFKEEIFPNTNCAGSPLQGKERKIGECDKTQQIHFRGASEKTTSCSTEYDTVTMKVYPDASCSESELLISGKAWRGELGKCVLFDDMQYGISGCNEDKTYFFKRYSDSSCTNVTKEDFTALAPGDCIPYPDKNDEMLGSMFVKIEGDLGCGLEWVPDDATSGTVHMAAFGSVVWLLAQSVMLFQ